MDKPTTITTADRAKHAKEWAERKKRLGWRVKQLPNGDWEAFDGQNCHIMKVDIPEWRGEIGRLAT